VPWGRGNGILEWRALHIGGYYHPGEELAASSLPNFTGSMQQLSFNGLHYLDMAEVALHPNGISQVVPMQITAKLGKREQPLVHHPVTFKSKRTFVALPVLKSYSNNNIYFQVRNFTKAFFAYFQSPFNSNQQICSRNNFTKMKNKNPLLSLQFRQQQTTGIIRIRILLRAHFVHRATGR